MIVKAHIVTCALSEKFRSIGLLLFDCPNECLVLQSTLCNVVVVDIDVVTEDKLELVSGTESGLIDDITNTAVETLYHAMP